jgi:hypothetical protein
MFCSLSEVKAPPWLPSYPLTSSSFPIAELFLVLGLYILVLVLEWDEAESRCPRWAFLQCLMRDQCWWNGNWQGNTEVLGEASPRGISFSFAALYNLLFTSYCVRTSLARVVPLPLPAILTVGLGKGLIGLYNHSVTETFYSVLQLLSSLYKIILSRWPV